MNKILLLALVVALFMGCSKKNDSSPKSASITGKWYLTKDTVNTYAGNTLYDQDVEAPNHTDYVQFNADGTANELTGGVAETFTYTIKGNQITISYPQQTVGNETIYANTETGTFKVTSNSLYVYVSYTETDDNVTYKFTEASYLTNN